MLTKVFTLGCAKDLHRQKTVSQTFPGNKSGIHSHSFRENRGAVLFVKGKKLFCSDLGDLQGVSINKTCNQTHTVIIYVTKLSSQWNSQKYVSQGALHSRVADGAFGNEHDVLGVRGSSSTSLCLAKVPTNRNNEELPATYDNDIKKNIPCENACTSQLLYQIQLQIINQYKSYLPYTTCSLSLSLSL